MRYAIAALALACSAVFAAEPASVPVEKVVPDDGVSADRLPAGAWCGFKMHGIPASRRNCGGFDPESTCPKNFVRISMGVDGGTLGTSEGKGTLYFCVRT
jgi:hypothetical protein